jgi:DedD protein
MFKPRSTAAASDATPASIEVIRVRARQRLIGAAVLVGIGVIGFPLVFDTEPRPLSADVPIDIPARQMSIPAVPALPAPVAQVPQAAVAPQESLDGKEEIVAPQAPVAPEPVVEVAPKPAAAAKPVARAEATTATKPSEATKPAEKPAVKTADKPVDKSADNTADKGANPAADKLPTTNARIVVQVGAFSEAAKAREARLKLERAGLPTYTNVAKTPDGERIRVRMGPFKTKAEADKAAARAKALGLEAGLYWL